MNLPFGQTFEPRDVLVILLLVLLEAAMSIDNALVLGILAQKLPAHLRKRALSYGLVGAFFFRLIAIVFAAKLLDWDIVKLLGGLYLMYVAIKHLVAKKEKTRMLPRELAPDCDTPSAAERKSFWSTVVSIELTDLAFAVDSVLAAIALVGDAPGGTTKTGSHPKLWVVVIGGMLGVILMRFAAVMFIRILEKFPRFEMSAYLLVLIIGLKLAADWAFDVSGIQDRFNFHSPSSPAFWVFWLSMAAGFGFGFLPKKPHKTVAAL